MLSVANPVSSEVFSLLCNDQAEKIPASNCFRLKDSFRSQIEKENVLSSHLKYIERKIRNMERIFNFH